MVLVFGVRKSLPSGSGRLFFFDPK